jgi:hypothetical protein
MAERILDALKRELAADYATYEEIYKKSKNLVTQAATMAKLDTIKKYSGLIERLQLEEKKKLNQVGGE